jgi:hypothetical protein
VSRYLSLSADDQASVMVEGSFRVAEVEDDYQLDANEDIDKGVAATFNEIRM